MLQVLDEIDRKLLNVLSESPDIAQIELSKQLGISQPAISARIQRLREAGILVRFMGTDLKKSQLFLAKVDAVTTDPTELLKIFESCPLYLNSFLTSGKYNVSILLIGENVRSLMSCADSHLRSNPCIKDMEFNIIVTTGRDFIVPIKPVTEKKKTTPCEKDCSACVLYANDRCLGCPASTDYAGKLL